MKTIRNNREMTLAESSTSVFRELFELKIQLDLEISKGGFYEEEFRGIALAIDQLLTELLLND
ncbi:MAG: hypothetical protein AB8B56_03120 [Crocinitomicaceae bacterium]